LTYRPPDVPKKPTKDGPAHAHQANRNVTPFHSPLQAQMKSGPKAAKV
jgi:hypothetical protein